MRAWDGLETDPSIREAKETSVTSREELLERLSGLLDAQFEELVFLLDIPPHYRMRSGARMQQAIEIITYLEGQSRLDDLGERLEKYAPSAPPTLPYIPAQSFPMPIPPRPVRVRRSSLHDVLTRWKPALTPRSRVVPIATFSAAIAAAFGTLLWPSESRVVDSPGDLSAAIVDFAMGSAWHNGPDAAGRLATDAVITSPMGQKPVLELTRVFDAHIAEAGDMGLGWRLFQAYSIKPSDDIEQKGSYTVPSSITLRNQIAGTETRLVLGSQDAMGYVGAGLAPWNGLKFKTNGGAYLYDGRTNEIEFEPDRSMSVVLVGDARWVLEHHNGRVVALKTIPRAIVAKSHLADGTLTVVDLDDALDPATFELQDESAERVLRPRTTGRWEKIVASKDGASAVVVDRWGNEIYYRPLDKFYVFFPGSSPPPLVRSGGGIQFTYDGYGRIQAADLGAGGRVTYEYDASGRLASVVDSRGRRKEYRYSSGSAPVALVSMHALAPRISLAALAVLLLAFGLWKLRK